MSEQIKDTTETAPESCPFCGAGLQDEGILQWKCGTGWSTTDPRDDQSHKCAAIERERLTRERDEAREQRDDSREAFGHMKRSYEEAVSANINALNQIGDLCAENAKLLARVTRLEDAGDVMERRLERFSSGGLDTSGRADRQPASIEGLVVADFRLVDQAIQQWNAAKEAKP